MTGAYRARRPKGADIDVSDQLPAKLRADGLTYGRRAARSHLRKADAHLAAVIDAAGAFTVRPDPDLEPYPYLLRSIVYQQLNGTAAATIHGRVLGLFGDRVPTPDELLGTSVDELRSAGLSASKAASMHDLARHAAAGELPTHADLPTMSDLAIVDALTVVRGIGPWTVHMLLMFRLGRPDVLPTGDFGVREGWRMIHGLERQPTPSEFRAATEHWRPYRSVASWYMWRAVDLVREGRPMVLPD
ncbi:MAG: DNA-3-methyladenine glycosylase [Thermoleophilia bacterium]|nr:DNA-3-methyladenine glycosylase [Thermoleophilia bacterium]